MRKLVLESAALLTAIVAGVLALLHLEQRSVTTMGITLVLAMLAAALAVAAGFAAEVVARLWQHNAIRRLASALLLYGLVVVPATSTGTAVSTVDTIVVVAVRHTATLLTLVLLLLAVVPVDRPRPWPVRPLRTPATGLRGLLVAVLCSAAAGTLAGLFPEVAYWVVRSPVLIFGVLLLWLNAGVVTVVAGLLRRHRMLVWFGFGELAVLGGHLPRLWTGDPLLYSPLLVPGARVLGTGLMLLAVLQVLRRMYQRLRLDQERLVEAEAEAVEARERLSVQAHELRNALAGVDGAARLLTVDDPAGGIDRTALSAALSAELQRMRSLLTPRSEQARTRRCQLGSLLHTMAVIRRESGTRIDLAVDDGLAVAVPQDVVAQVITNILANCERHAPGARVRVEAHPLGDTVRVRVADDGPGLPPGKEDEVLRRGVKGSESAGDGLGLYVCRRLVTEHGGQLRLEPSRPDRPGCVVLLDLPADTASPRPDGPPTDRDGR